MSTNVRVGRPKLSVMAFAAVALGRNLSYSFPIIKSRVYPSASSYHVSSFYHQYRPTQRRYISAETPVTHHPKVLVPMANGTEEMEAVVIIDTLVRAGVNVISASVHDLKLVKCSRGVEITTVSNIRDCVEREWDCIVLPGGMPGAEHLAESPTLQHILKDQHKAKRLIGAICASPAVVLAPLGILEGRTATCYPSNAFTSKLPHYDAKESLLVVEDGHIITSKGPGTALAFALKIAGRLMGEDVEARVAKEMLA